MPQKLPQGYRSSIEATDEFRNIALQAVLSLQRVRQGFVKTGLS
ncbi:hypothetical protein J2W36_004432 [Variovorax ginsengisoli]|uniref:Uncharacterized protein n=1 Tax=Variovorax ginsengisoli TaxID=363844 RepID=A0ABT9SCT3_9BURK|nr:hypothetical protein [Variovorax ginsengisoli]